MADDPLTGEDIGDAPAPRAWAPHPENWPRRIPFNGILPRRDLYPDPKADPAFQHLLVPSTAQDKKRRGKPVFPTGSNPNTWHPDYRPGGFGEIAKSKAAQKARPKTDLDEGAIDEEGPETYRALSRAYASLPEATLRRIVKKIAEQAADGDEKAQAAFIRLESLMARAPVTQGDGGVVKPETVVLAERYLDDLVTRVGAVLPDWACPWCGQDVHVEE